MFLTAIAGRIGVTELLIILLIVVVIFGPKQLPKLSKMFGKTVKNFKDGMEEMDEDEKKDTPAAPVENAPLPAAQENTENTEDK